MSIYDVSYLLISSEIFYLLLQKRPLPSFKWVKNSNNTHGYIRATVDFSVGPKAMEVIYYHAHTLNDKRFVQQNLSVEYREYTFS